jgi:hypothetical protein
MANVVKTTFVVDAKDALATADVVSARYGRLDSETASALSRVSTPITNQLNQVEAQAAKLRDSLRQTIAATQVSDMPVWQTWQTGARRAQSQLAELTREMRTLRLLADNTDDPDSLKRIQDRAKAASAEIDRLERKMGRVAEGRIGAAGRLQDPGILGNNTGIKRGLLNKILPPQLEAGVDAAELLQGLGVSGRTLAVGGAAAAAGFAAVKISERLKEIGEKHLAVETKKQGVLNAQALALKDSISHYRSLTAFSTKHLSQTQVALRQIQQTNIKQGFGFGDFGKQTLDQFLAPARAMRDFEARIEGAKTRTSELAVIMDDIAKGRIKNIDPKTLEQQLIRVALLKDQSTKTGFTKEDSEANERFFTERREREKARQEDVKSALKQVKDMETAFNDLFSGLTARSNADNPYVQFLIDSEKATRDLREQTRGLSEDLRAQADSMLRSQQQLQLFELRLNTRFETAGLRETAERFRSGGSDPARRREVADAGLEASVVRFQQQLASGVMRNLDAALQFSGFDLLNASPDMAANAFRFKRDQEQQEGLFRNPEIDELIEASLRRDEADRSVSERFNKQLEILQQAGAQTEEERALVDRRVLSLSESLNPEDLDQRQQIAVADAAERLAVRSERAEAEAARVRQETLEVNQRIAASTEELAAIAREGGTEALKNNLDIRVRNDTDGTVGVGSALLSRGSSADVASEYSGPTF